MKLVENDEDENTENEKNDHHKDDNEIDEKCEYGETGLKDIMVVENMGLS